jgi:hypothetical protein
METIVALLAEVLLTYVKAFKLVLLTQSTARRIGIINSLPTVIFVCRGVKEFTDTCISLDPKVQ